MKTGELRERLVMGKRQRAAWWLGAVVAMASVSCGGKNLQLVGERVGDSGSGGAEGSEGGAGNVGLPGGAAAGDGNEGGYLNAGGSPEQPSTGTVFFEGLSPVRGIAANATTLYWVEYGSKDSLGNFQNDGRLLARDFGAEDVRVLADDLPGAVNVGVTSTHALVYVDQLYAGGPRSALVRMTFEGKESAVVALDVGPFSSGGGVCLRCLVAVNSAAYYVDEDAIFRIAAEETEARVLVNGNTHSIAANGETFYYANDEGVWSVFDASNPVKISTQARAHLQVSGNFAYGLDNDSGGTYLARMPLEGGNWMRLEPKHEGMYAWQLQLTGDLFFHDLHLTDGKWQIVQGRLSDTASAQAVAELPEADTMRAWVGTPAGVFWSDDTSIRHAPLATP